jgi:hypothetical protein
MNHPGTEQVDELLRQANDRMRNGAVEEAPDLFVQAADLARSLGDARRLALAWLGYGAPDEVPSAQSAEDSLIAGLREALTLLPQSEAELKARVLARLAMAVSPTSPTEAEGLLREASEIAHGSQSSIAILEVLRAQHFVGWSSDGAKELGEAQADFESEDLRTYWSVRITGGWALIGAAAFVAVLAWSGGWRTQLVVHRWQVGLLLAAGALSLSIPRSWRERWFGARSSLVYWIQGLDILVVTVGVYFVPEFSPAAIAIYALIVLHTGALRSGEAAWWLANVATVVFGAAAAARLLDGCDDSAACYPGLFASRQDFNVWLIVMAITNSVFLQVLATSTRRLINHMSRWVQAVTSITLPEERRRLQGLLVDWRDELDLRRRSEAGECVLEVTSRYFHLSFEGLTLHRKPLRHADKIEAVLLANPGKRFSPAELLEVADLVTPDAAALEQLERLAAELEYARDRADQDDGNDPMAAALAARVAEVEGQIEDAIRTAEWAWAVKRFLEERKKKLADELARTARDEKRERFRRSIARIEEQLRRIDENQRLRVVKLHKSFCSKIPDTVSVLQDLFTRCVKVGKVVCVYDPDPGTPPFRVSVNS